MSEINNFADIEVEDLNLWYGSNQALQD
ncbi:MAG: hypothetical protein CI952_1358, partial [Methanohalophilus sp.]